MLKVDGVMGKADNLMLGLNAIAGGNAGGELFQTVKSIRELADDFDKRSGALMTDGRKTLGDISRAVNNLDRNPTRLLFGAGNSNAPPAGDSAAAQASGRPRRARRRSRNAQIVPHGFRLLYPSYENRIQRKQNGGIDASVFYCVSGLGLTRAVPLRARAGCRPGRFPR